MSGFGAMMMGAYNVPTAPTGSGGTSFKNLATAGSYLTTAMNALGSGDFTIEAWIWNSDPTTSSGINRNVCDSRSSGGNDNGVFIYYNPAANNIIFHFQAGGALTLSGLTDNAWNHIAVVRSSGVVRGFVGGVYGGFMNNSTNKSSTTFRIGAFIDDTSTNSVWYGYLDDLRVSSSVRYPSTTTFTPPSQLVSDADTNLLFNFNGTDGSTTITEDGPSGRTVTRSGTGITLSATQYKY